MSLLRRLLGLFHAKGDEVRAASLQAMPPAVASRPTLQELPTDTDARRIVQQVCTEAIAASDSWRTRLSDSARWLRLKDAAPETQIAVLWAALDQRSRGSVSYKGDAWRVEDIRKQIVSQLLRRSLPLTADQLAELLDAWLKQPYSLEYGLPGNTLLGAVERYLESRELPPALKHRLGRLRTRALKATPVPNKYSQAVADRIARLLDPASVQEFKLPAGPFAAQLQKWIDALGDAERQRWQALARLAAEAGDKSKPTNKWLTAAQPATDAIGRAPLAAQLTRWFEEITPDPSRPDNSLDVLKGLIWLSPLLDHGEIASPLGRFADKCFRKVTNFGARSAKLGNAALWALSEMSGEPGAAAELFRLRDKVKYPSAQKRIADRLADLAAKDGQSLADMEDLSLPDFGLGADGVATAFVGEARVELRLHADRLDVHWFNAEGGRLKSVPAAVRKERGGGLADVRRRSKDIDEARAGQVLRFERSWLEDRDWSLADWRARLLGHPLRRPIVEALIWRVGAAVVMPTQGALTDVEGQPLDFPDDARVRLWHPLDGDPQQVLAWRQRILDVGITQPIKQAHREVYVLTDAERRTNTYSNRFAAHILRQHQFRALCQARGWRYGLMGGWDGWNAPTLLLPRQGLSVEYHVDVVDNGQHAASGVSLHLATDQVRFTDIENRPVELEAISPIVFSEVLRDVDLFVAVTSVANDPGWTDGGPDGRHGGYWREWAFGELGQSAATRKELISWIAPRLSIADKLDVTDKFLIVTGRRQKYAIHFGSSNIQILPSKRYLCIVPDRSPPEASALKLPFTGDGVLSSILAKAFLLVDESKIRDQTILSQL